MRQNLPILALVVVCCLGVLGCGGGETSLEGTVPVSGTVTQNGAPLEGAAVTFSPTADGRSASGLTDAEGKFTLTTLEPGDGAFPGEYQVAVTKKETVGKEYTPEEANEYYNKFQKQPPAPATKNLVAEKFAVGATSGLMAVVPEDGVEDLTFDVQ